MGINICNLNLGAMLRKRPDGPGIDRQARPARAQPLRQDRQRQSIEFERVLNDTKPLNVDYCL